MSLNDKQRASTMDREACAQTFVYRHKRQPEVECSLSLLTKGWKRLAVISNDFPLWTRWRQNAPKGKHSTSGCLLRLTNVYP